VILSDDCTINVLLALDLALASVINYAPKWCHNLEHLYEKTTYQFQIKFITDDYVQLYKTLQLFTNTFTINTNKFISIKVIKYTYVQTQSY